jgi:hypothetical protein
MDELRVSRLSGTVQATFELLTYVARTTLHNSVDGRQSGGGGHQGAAGHQHGVFPLLRAS